MARNGSQTEGITIVFEGETVPFDKSVDGVKKSLQLLKAQTNAWKKEFQKTGDVEALKKQISSLEQEQEKAALQVKLWAEYIRDLAEKGEQNTDQYKKALEHYKKAQAQLTKVGMELEKNQGLLDEFIKTPWKQFLDNVTEAGDKLQDVGKGIQDAARQLKPASDAAQKVLKQSLQSAIEYESAFADVKKTVEETNTTSYDQLSEDIRSMAMELPTTAKDFAEVVAMSGQMGVGADSVIEFSKAMVDLGNSTNVNASEAAETIAQLYNVMGKGQDFSDINNFASAIVELGNNSATTESAIIEMARNIGAAGSSIKMSEDQILGWSAALASLGLDKGGASAISKVMREIDKDVAHGGESLAVWAETAGMSAAQFKKVWQEDASTGLAAFIQGLADAKGEGDNLNLLLEDLGIKELRQIDTVSRLTNASETLSTYLTLSNDAYRDGNALTNEANKRYQTFASKIQVLKNNFEELAIQIGEILMPVLDTLIDFAKTIATRLNAMTTEQKQTAAAMTTITAVAAPLMNVVGVLITKVGWFISNLPSLLTKTNLVAAGIFLLFTRSEEFRNAVFNLASAIWDRLKPVLERLYAVFQDVWHIIDTVIQIVGRLFAKFMDSSAGNYFIQMIRNIIGVLEAMVSVVQSVIGWVRNLVDWLGNAIGLNSELQSATATTTSRTARLGKGEVLPLYSGGLGLTTNIHVTNNGTPIDEAEISRWVDVMADRLDVALGRRM